MNGTSPETLNATLNFIFLPPTSGNVVLTVTDNPPGPNFVSEANTANNTFSTAPLTFVAHKVTELAYVPIDYRPTGGDVPNLPDPALIEPGMGDNFVQGIYPTKDWYFHRTAAPSKLWTQSLDGDGSVLLDSLSVDINLMSPKPDFLYAFVPGALPYNGQSVIGGNVAMGNTEVDRYQRTVAHELGHNFGLQHNTLTTNLVGVDVEHHLNLPLGLPQIKSATLKDIMYAGLLTPGGVGGAAQLQRLLQPSGLQRRRRPRHGRRHGQQRSAGADDRRPLEPDHRRDRADRRARAARGPPHHARRAR